jgi:4-amino-4-deoxy-L-arabinose transferase-like glycosyltransferase
MMAPNIKNYLYQNLDIIFVSLFLIVTLSLLWVPARWDEWAYLDFVWFPLNPSGWWVPHPPLLWYLLAAFSPIPRMAILMCSLVSMLFLFYACKRLYGAKIAGLAVTILATNWLYMLLGSLVMFTDGPVTVFMTISTISFLCWLKLDEQKFLLISGLGLALASVTKYTAAPIILATSVVWLIISKKRLVPTKILKMLGVAAVSLVPLVIWFYALYQTYGNFIAHYSTLYDTYPSTSLATFAFNIGYYAIWTLALANVYLISWVRQRQFDLDSKLLLAHIMVIFLLFAILNKQDFGNFRYVLPMAPSIAIISAKNMIKEKGWLRFLIILVQFLCASVISYVALVLNPF